MNPLSLVTGPFRIYAILALVASLVGLYTWRVHAEREFGRDEVRTEQKAADLIQAKKNAEETKRRIDAQQEVVNHARQETIQARSDAVLATDAATRLRNHIRTLRCSPTSDHPPATSGSQTTSTAADLLDNVQRRSDDAADAIARYADESRIAGQACVRAYESLSR